MKKYSIYLFTIAFFTLLASAEGYSQSRKFIKNGSFYFSWGYNMEWYGPSNLHIVQPSMGNDYTFEKVEAHDRIGWDRVFQVPVTIPQYNYRVGYFFNEAQDLGIELSFDHTKYIISQGQTVHVSGKINDVQTDRDIVLTDSVLRYQLNNGANFFLINIVKKVDMKALTSGQGNIKTALLLKAGIGPVVPHVENTIFTKDNVPHFQLGGWNTGVEIALKTVLYKHVYLEFCNKVDYARYSQLRIYNGLANHSFFTYEIILNMGYTFNLGKHCKDCPARSDM